MTEMGKDLQESVSPKTNKKKVPLFGKVSKAKKTANTKKTAASSKKTVTQKAASATNSGAGKKKAVTTRKTGKVSSKTSKPDFLWLKSYPPAVKWDIDIPEQPLWSLMDQAVSKAAEKNCIDFLGKKYTYQEIGNLIDRAAEGLQELGVEKGTKVGIFMPNTPYFVIAYFAILKAGGVIVNYNPLYVDHEIKHQINDSETEIILTLDLKLLCDKLIAQLDETHLKKLVICSVADSLPFPKNYLFRIFKSREIAKIPNDKRISWFRDLIDNGGSPKAVQVDPKKDVALLQYTGGTTGVPKGAMLTHYNVYANAAQAVHWFEGIGYGTEKILAGLPLFHVYAMTAVMTLAVYTASEMIMMFPRFDPLEAMKLIQKHKVTFFPGVPTMYNMISNHPKVKDIDLSSLKECLSGGASLPLKIKQDFEELTGCKLVEAYGLSETSPAATSNPIYGVNKIGSIGVPFPRTEIKVVSLDDPSKEVGLNENGQIAIKGPQVMSGYWKRPDETKKVFVGGFLLTGDVGHMDADGYIFLVDRIKDLIICSGFNVYPRVVEEAIYHHPAVAEVTVIGVADEKRGETVKAFVKLKENMQLTDEELLEFLQDRLSPIEMPRHIEFRDELPKTMIGKLSKKELKAEENLKLQKT